MPYRENTVNNEKSKRYDILEFAVIGSNLLVSTEWRLLFRQFG